MIQRILYLTAFLISGAHAGAQTTELRLYFSNIYAAENKIIQGKPERALQRYQRAFQYRYQPLVKDLNNALICALEVNDREYIRLYSCQLRKLGVSPDFYADYDNFQPFESCPEPDCKRADFGSLDSLIQAARAVRACEQALPECQAAIAAVDSSNYLFWQNWVSLQGWPSEEELQLESPDATPFYEELILNSLASAQDPQPIIVELRRRCLDGWISPRFYARCVQHTGDYLPHSPYPAMGEGSIFYLGPQVFIWEQSLEEDWDSNKWRLERLLEPVGELRSKVLFQQEYPEYVFVHKVYLSDLSVYPEPYREELIKRIKNGGGRFQHVPVVNPARRN